MQVNDLEYLSLLSKNELLDFFKEFSAFIKEECLIERLVVVINDVEYIF